MNRRVFLQAVLGALIVAPVARFTEKPLWSLPSLVDDGTWRRSYLNAVIPQRKLMARIRISGDVIRASVHQPPGSFMRYAREEHARAMREFANELARHGLIMGEG